MSNEIIAELIVNGKDEFVSALNSGAKSVDVLDKNIDELTKTQKENTASTKGLTNEINNNTNTNKKNTSSILDTNNAIELLKTGQITAREATKKLKIEMVKLALEGKQTSKEYLNLRNTLGQITDAIGDVSAEISQAGSDTRGIDHAIRATNTLVSGFGLVEGATALFGNESEKLQQTLVKVNGLMLIMNSLQQVQEELNKKDSIFIQAKTKALALYNIVLGASSGALRIFRLALAGTGLLLIIPLIATLVANFDKLKAKLYEVFPSLKNIGTSFSEIKDNVIDFIKGALLGFLNGFSQAYNSSLLLRVAISALGATFKTVGGGIVLIAKNISTVFSTLWSAISDPKNAISILKTGFKDIITNFKDFGKNTADNFKQGFENAKKNRLELLDENDLFPKGKKTGEKAGENLAKDVKKGAEQQAKGDPIVLEFELKLNDIESETKQRLEDAIANFKNSFSEALKNNDLENPLLKAEVEQIKILEKELEDIGKKYNDFFNAPNEDTGVQLPTFNEGFNTQDFLDSIDEMQGISKEKYLEYYEYINELRNQDILDEERANEAILNLNNKRLEAIGANAEKVQGIYSKVFDIFSQGAELASQIISQNAEKEISVLDEKKNKGLISEKEYNKEVAKIKNEQAQKQRKIDIAMAVAKIPMIALEAFSAGLQFGGLIGAGIFAGIATAFAVAQVALLSKAPLPKFRHGGSVEEVFRGSGYVKGKSHEQGGRLAELEGKEFVLKKEAVNKYGIKNLENLNNTKLSPDIFSSIGRLDFAPPIYSNTTNNDLDKLKEHLIKLGSYQKQNYKTIEKSNEILNLINESLKSNNKYG